MERIDKLTTWDMDTVRHRPLLSSKHKERDVPEPTKENMEKLVNKVAELTEMVNILAERQGLIDEESEKETVEL